MLKKALTGKGVFVGFLLLTFAIYVINISEVGLCSGDYSCANFLSSFIKPLLFLFIPATIIVLVLNFLKHEVLHAWLYFFVPWAVLYLLVIYGAPVHDGGYIGPSSREIYSVLGDYIFVGISLLIILIKSIQVYRKRK